MSISDSEISSRAQTEVNPAYVSAPYRVEFMFWVYIPPAVLGWTWKRQKKWIQRARKNVRLPNPPSMNALPGYEYMGELEWHNVP